MARGGRSGGVRMHPNRRGALRMIKAVLRLNYGEGKEMPNACMHESLLLQQHALYFGMHIVSSTGFHHVWASVPLYRK